MEAEINKKNFNSNIKATKVVTHNAKCGRTIARKINAECGIDFAY